MGIEIADITHPQSHDHSAAGDGTTLTPAAVNISGNLQVNGGDIGISADTDLLGLASGALTVRGIATIEGITTIQIASYPQLVITNVLTDATDKHAMIGASHYTIAEEPMAIVYGANNVGTNRLNIGGGATQMNTATDIRFYTAANTITTMGSVRMTIDLAGNIGVGTTDPDGFEVDAAVTETAQGRDNIRLGVLGGTPRIIFEDASATQWEIDNSAGVLRFINPGVVRASIGLGLQVGTPTGGDKGAGTANFAADIYKNNSAYTNPDFVFEHWATGRIEQFANSPGANDYHGLPTLAEVELFIRDKFRLPYIPDTPMGAFERSDYALRAIEELYLYLIDHDNRLQKLAA